MLGGLSSNNHIYLTYEWRRPLKKPSDKTNYNWFIVFSDPRHRINVLINSDISRRVPDQQNIFLYENNNDP